jgi:hemolysin activation/secretion protein
MLRPLMLATCLPLSVFTVWSQTCPPGTAPVPTSPVHIRNIVFTNAGLLLAEKQQEISSKLREEAASAIDGPPEQVSLADQDQGATNLADETAGRIQAEYQDEGYFKVEVTGKARRVAEDLQPRYDIVIRVIDSGEQYRLSEFNIVGASHFPTQQLRDLFPIQRGEVFSREKIAAGLEALRRLYGAEGYINAIPFPDTQFDDEHATANLTVNVDEGKQLRLGHIDILGVDPETTAQILGELTIKPGDVLRSDLWAGALEELKTLLPNNAGIAYQQERDQQEGTVTFIVEPINPTLCPFDLSYSTAIPLSPR